MTTPETPLEIPDRCFRLALVSALVYEKILEPIDLHTLQQEYKLDDDELLEYSEDGETVGEDDWMYVLNYALFDELADRPITASQLSRLKELHYPEWAHSNKELTFVEAIFPQWSGEEGEFNIHDLTGIEHCTGLEIFDVADCMVSGAAQKQHRALATMYPSKRAAMKKPARR